MENLINSLNDAPTNIISQPNKEIQSVCVDKSIDHLNPVNDRDEIYRNVKGV